MVKTKTKEQLELEIKHYRIKISGLQVTLDGERRKENKVTAVNYIGKHFKYTDRYSNDSLWTVYNKIISYHQNENNGFFKILVVEKRGSNYYDSQLLLSLKYLDFSDFISRLKAPFEPYVLIQEKEFKEKYDAALLKMNAVV
ncbi:hypothetical protein LCGC14_0195080 [marine sediment metagenome]|uniref:Uncharacterized protein n=1 Tax=marine sediment metagenome TaxID=412755 RepID=A0A0F9UK91_9ZZZZ